MYRPQSRWKEEWGRKKGDRMNRPPSKIELLEKEKRAQQEVWARACKHSPEKKTR